MAHTCLFHTLGRCAGSCPGASSRTPLPGTARLPGCSLTPRACKPGESTGRQGAAMGDSIIFTARETKGLASFVPVWEPISHRVTAGNQHNPHLFILFMQNAGEVFSGASPAPGSQPAPLSLHSPVNREVQSQCACTRNAGYSALGWEIFTPAGSLGQLRDMRCAGLAHSASPACGYPGSH